MCEHPKLFSTILNSKTKKIAVHSKLIIKIIGTLLLIVRFVKISDEIIIQIIRKNKSNLMFLIDPSNCFRNGRSEIDVLQNRCS